MLESDEALYAYVITFTLAVTPMVIAFDGRAHLAALMLLVAGVVHQLLFTRLDEGYWAHIIPAVMLIRGGANVFAGGGGPMTPPLPHSLVALAVACVALRKAVVLFSWKLVYSSGHVVLWSTLVVLASGWSAHAVAVSCGRDRLAARLRAGRVLFGRAAPPAHPVAVRHFSIALSHTVCCARRPQTPPSLARLG